MMRPGHKKYSAKTYVLNCELGWNLGVLFFDISHKQESNITSFEAMTRSSC